ncbi:hypothetical protein GMOD_00008834 [Pyrenophora seminiperda CCB06]|uniref:Uncharacterized protein n=1 Tax=Pyrenophora seminiperda CCB06 TaxID=1302712 RepID=A0A3M7M665_9PLEO|nr:hypothetical protein GMOD_00008834 [Pyrenophora seminiperda CCB06]
MKMHETQLTYSRHRTEHLQILEVRNTLNANRAPEINQLKSEVMNLRLELKDVKMNADKKVNEALWLKQNIAYHIMQLDLAEQNLRVFDCKHDDLKCLRSKVTREKHAGHVASEMFKQNRTDGEFMAEYVAARQYIISHHVAHEQSKPGRGHGSGIIENTLLAQDAKRGVTFSYT